MTISSQIRTAGPFEGDGATAAFPFAFKVFQASDVLVPKTSNGIEAALVLSADYTVLLNADQNTTPGGTVHLTGPLAVGDSLSITSNLKPLQPLSLPNGGAFFPRNLEDAFDRICILLQQFGYFVVESNGLTYANIGQAIRVPEIAGASPLASAAERANRLLGFDDTGAPIATLPTAGDATGLALSLLNPTDPTKGANLVGLDASAQYALKTVGRKLSAYKDSNDTGTVKDGTASATAALQKLLDYAWYALYYQAQVWLGVDTGGANPVVKIAPGRYKLDGSLTMSTGTSLSGFAHPANTVSHTRLIMDSTSTGGPGDRRNVPILKFSRVTKNGAALANAACTVAISNLEFWYVTGSNNFDNPLGGSGLPPYTYPLGGSLFFDVDHTDTRIENVCFQHAPAAVRGLNVPATSTIRGDGFPGASGINVFFKGCEFDAGAHIWFTNCEVDLEFDNCTFYGMGVKFEQCTGRVVFHANCRFYGGASIDAATGASNNFREFVVDSRFEAALYQPSIGVYGAKFLSIRAHIRGASGASAIVAVACTGGVIEPVIQDSGYNAQVGTGGNDYVAAVKLIGCQQVIVSSKIGIVATDGLWNGFGLLSLDGAEAPGYGTSLTSSVVIADAVCTAAYNATPLRGQSRSLNLAAGDICLSSFTGVRPMEERSSTGLNLRGITLVPPTLLASAASNDLATLISESGVYDITVQTQYQNNLAAINLGTFRVARRTAGGIVAQQIALSNAATISGVISLSGSLLSYTYSSGTPYYVTIRCNKLSDGGVG